jgi:putative glutamine amidotransferase
MINSKSDDGIIEGIEFADKTDKSFLIGVQWHPERFLNADDPASGNILKYFISESEKKYI